MTTTTPPVWTRQTEATPVCLDRRIGPPRIPRRRSFDFEALFLLIVLGLIILGSGIVGYGIAVALRGA